MSWRKLNDRTKVPHDGIVWHPNTISPGGGGGISAASDICANAVLFYYDSDISGNQNFTYDNNTHIIDVSGNNIIGVNGVIEFVTSSIAIGLDALDRYPPSSGAISIGDHAGQTGQQAGAVAIGNNAGAYGQTGAVAIGKNAGATGQYQYAVAIGDSAGYSSQGVNSVAIGQSAGYYSQGANAVAIGQNAGQTGQLANSIVINAGGTAINGATASACYIAPIRSDLSNNFLGLNYNISSKEITSGRTIQYNNEFMPGNGTGIFMVTFPFAFASTPSVTATLCQGNTTYIFVIQITSITSSTFTYRQYLITYPASIVAVAGDLHSINWIAIGDRPP